jgi:hypothetical protein
LIYGGETITVIGCRSCLADPPVDPLPPPSDDPLPDPQPGGGGGGGPDPLPLPECVTAQPPANRVDYSLTIRNEGGILTNPYVPLNTSGLTLGAGVDLSRWSAGQLAGWGMSQQFIAGVSPYLGIGSGVYGPTGSRARAIFASSPFVVSQADAEFITRAAENTITSWLVSHFNSRASYGIKFYELPSAAQTILFDAAYQYGPALDKTAAAAFFNQMASGNYLSAVAELYVLGRTYSRYNTSARMLSQALSRGELPPAANGKC